MRPSLSCVCASRLLSLPLLAHLLVRVPMWLGWLSNKQHV